MGTSMIFDNHGEFVSAFWAYARAGYNVSARADGQPTIPIGPDWWAAGGAVDARTVREWKLFIMPVAQKVA